jgi:hypothetical protein
MNSKVVDEWFITKDWFVYIDHQLF